MGQRGDDEPATAESLGVELEDLVEVRYDGRTVQGGVWIWPGHVDNAITVHLGYGRSQTGLAASRRRAPVE